MWFFYVLNFFRFGIPYERSLIFVKSSDKKIFAFSLVMWTELMWCFLGSFNLNWIRIALNCWKENPNIFYHLLDADSWNSSSWMTMTIKTVNCQVRHSDSLHNQVYTQCLTIKYHIFITVTWQRGLEAITDMSQYHVTPYLLWVQIMVCLSSKINSNSRPGTWL